MTKKIFPLACPIDLTPLTEKKEGYYCEHNHCYDKAKQGYVNLLPVQMKKSKAPGDNKQMVSARAYFLSTGLYDFLIDEITTQIRTFIKNKCCLIDAGCGEGYYTSLIKKRLSDYQELSLIGFDISKEAIKEASKKDKEIAWLVATNNKIPLLNKSVDVVLSLFGFPVIQEFQRVLKQQGILIVLVAGKKHLMELRQCVYQTVIEKEAHLLPPNDVFELKTQKNIFVKIPITGMQIDALLKMTPHFYRMKKDQYEAFLKKPPCEITLDFVLGVYQQKGCQ